jgi:hypothetical protein
MSKRVQSKNGMWHDADMVRKGVLELEPKWWASEPVRRAARTQAEHLECVRLELWESLNDNTPCRADECPNKARRKSVVTTVCHGARVMGVSEEEVWMQTGLMLMATEAVW